MITYHQDISNHFVPKDDIYDLNISSYCPSFHISYVQMKYVMCHFDERLRRIEKTLCLPDIEEEIPEIDGPMVTGASMVSGASMFSETGPQDITAEVNSPNSTRSLTQRLAVAETSLEKQDRSRSFNRSDSISRHFSNSSRTSTTESTPRKSQKRQTSSGSRSPEGKFKKKRRK